MGIGSQGGRTDALILHFFSSICSNLPQHGCPFYNIGKTAPKLKGKQEQDELRKVDVIHLLPLIFQRELLRKEMTRTKDGTKELKKDHGKEGMGARRMMK
jgi:hypothetical protein